MKHISDKEDWFYELRPYIIIGLGIGGILSRFVFASGPSWAMINFLSSLVLISSGAYIISLRKDYRKKSSWMK